MNESFVQELRYSTAYKIILGLLNLLLLSFVVFISIKLYSTARAFDLPFVILISLLGGSIFYYYKLLQYTRYVLQWYASLSDQGLSIYDPRKGQLDYYWDTDIVAMDSFNLCLVKGHYGPPERMSRTYSDFKISKWLSGHKHIVDSQVKFLAKRQFKHVKINEIDQTRLIEDSRNTYHQFLNNNKWNMLFLGFYFSRIVAVLLVLYIVLFDIGYFNPSIAFGICIIVGIQLGISFQYLNLLTVSSSLKQLVNCIVSILAFFYIMFDNVHFKDEIFFYKWGLLFGSVLTIGIFLFVYLYRPIMLSLEPKIKFSMFFICFTLISLFSVAFLKVGNIAFSEQPLVWEKGTAEAPLIEVIMLGVDRDYVVFDNKEWGRHDMGLFFLSWSKIKESSKRVELLTYKGRLGIPWMYKNYHRDETEKAKVITDTE